MKNHSRLFLTSLALALTVSAPLVTMFASQAQADGPHQALPPGPPNPPPPPPAPTPHPQPPPKPPPPHN